MSSKFNYLILETGEIYKGIGYGAKVNTIGELVFNTSITGYQEVITDQSYKGQIIIFTYPHIGNVGTCNQDSESTQVLLKAIITREIPTQPSNWRSNKSLKKYLLDNNIPGLAEIDTRNLTNKIRNTGNIIGMVVRNKLKPIDALKKILQYKNDKPYYNHLFLSTKKIKNIFTFIKNNNDIKLHLLLIDLGYKESILNMLKELDSRISILGSNTTIEQIKNFKPDAVIISNGPGDPRHYKKVVNLIKKVINAKLPILGICLGHQLLGIALGAQIIKLQFGHHGTNHPVKNLVSNKVFITSQNHNYSIDWNALPSNMSITHVSLFDNSIQGFEYNLGLAVGFQGHPEGSPGPIDVQNDIIKKFLNAVLNAARTKHLHVQI